MLRYKQRYRQLTKEQFEELHIEFSNFLATQQVDKNQWDNIVLYNPSLAQDQLNVFSDMVWEKVLSNVLYLEHYSKKILNLFYCNQEQIYRIVIEIKKQYIDLLSKDGIFWALENLNCNNNVLLYKGFKKYEHPRNDEIFDLIEKGSVITKGELFTKINNAF